MADEEDDDGWTVADLNTDRCEGVVPNRATTLRLLDEYHKMWIGVKYMGQKITASNLMQWVASIFNITLDNFTWEDYFDTMMAYHEMTDNLKGFLERHDLDLDERFKEITYVLYNVTDLFKEYVRLLRSSHGEAGDMNLSPDQERDFQMFDALRENVLINDQMKNTNFQKAYLHLTKVIRSTGYRRANGRFFQEIKTCGGLGTLAFEEVCTIAEFVAKHTAHHINFSVWKWTTDPVNNYPHLVDHLSTHVLPEAKELVEDCHLRAYAGDEFGRGAGIYDCACDMFFPYSIRSSWSQMAKDVEQIRCAENKKNKCKAPKDSSVCVIHLNAAFPYNIIGELVEMAEQVGTRWRNAEAFECAATTNDLQCPDLAAYLTSALPLAHSVEELVPASWGQSWQCVIQKEDFPPPGWTELIDLQLTEYIAGVHSTMPILPNELAKRIECLTPNGTTFVSVGDEFFIPLETPARRKRADITEVQANTWKEALSKVHGRSHVTHKAVDGSERHFRVDTGRTWLECEVDEIDHIYVCQKFGTQDRFLLYALKGRLFFEVGEFDNQELTLFFEGIGGCGKSTVMKSQQSFWPSHLRGILSPNMQPQFGMSAVSKAKVVFCNEVSADLNIVQEEWQTSVSGEWGSYAVKFKEPTTLAWVAQHFWVGNGFPSSFKNQQGQVSRRLGGVLMAHAVTPRDGNIMAKISKKLGGLQRKQVLAYFEFVAQTGSTQIMSVPDQLPTAFAEYYRKGRRATDPVEDFLSEGSYVKMTADRHMLMSDFKELYGRYRLDHDMGKAIKWSEASYRTPFNERGIVVRRTDIRVKNIDHHNVDVLYGVCALDEDEDT